MTTASAVCIFALMFCILSIHGSRLSSICGDPTRNSILCLEGGDVSFFYELNAENKAQISSRRVSAPYGSVHYSSFVFGDNTLYQTLSCSDGTSMRSFPLPLADNSTDDLKPLAPSLPLFPSFFLSFFLSFLFLFLFFFFFSL
eukprot:Phypoly_transcript_24945.p1 GENE.Phypoly_transcript_24945~~Phypoly_transcript_24945.p1  ORF type:complete len:162 (+),score=4.90 Phypoly_transcript_24945:59-487(+)